MSFPQTAPILFARCSGTIIPRRLLFSLERVSMKWNRYSALANSPVSLPRKASEGEAGDIMVGAAGDGKIGEDFTDHRGELEAVSRAWRGDDDPRRPGQPVENEIAVRRHGVETGSRGKEPTVGVWQVGAKGAADRCLVGGRYGPVIALRIDLLIEMLVLCNLDAVGVGRKSVKDAAWILQQENRKVPGRELRPGCRLEPAQHLASHADRHRELRQQRFQPRPGRHDGASGKNVAFLRFHQHPVVVGFNRNNALFRAYFRAGTRASAWRTATVGSARTKPPSG